MEKITASEQTLDTFKERHDVERVLDILERSAALKESCARLFVNDDFKRQFLFNAAGVAWCQAADLAYDNHRLAEAANNARNSSADFQEVITLAKGMKGRGYDPQYAAAEIVANNDLLNKIADRH